MSEEKEQHTELPWEVEAHNHVDDEPWHTILKGAVDITHNKQPHEIACDKYSALPKEENEANAEFIVKACNNHYQLLEALKKIRDIDGNIPTEHAAALFASMNRIAREAIKETE